MGCLKDLGETECNWAVYNFPAERHGMERKRVIISPMLELSFSCGHWLALFGLAWLANALHLILRI